MLTSFVSRNSESGEPSCFKIPEESYDNCFMFLEGCISIKNGCLTSYMASKNFHQLLTSGSPAVVSPQHFLSFSGEGGRAKCRLASILGRIAAAQSYSYPNGMLLQSFLHLLVQFVFLGYPRSVLKNACLKKYHSTKREGWKFLATLTDLALLAP